MTRDEKRLIRHLVECVRSMMVHIPACRKIDGRDEAVRILDACAALAREDTRGDPGDESLKTADDLCAELHRRQLGAANIADIARA